MSAKVFINGKDFQKFAQNELLNRAAGAGDSATQNNLVLLTSYYDQN
mgnify:CR=1 FL=1